jgi:hypothetical protein
VSWPSASAGTGAVCPNASRHLPRARKPRFAQRSIGAQRAQRVRRLTSRSGCWQDGAARVARASSLPSIPGARDASVTSRVHRGMGPQERHQPARRTRERGTGTRRHCAHFHTSCGPVWSGIADHETPIASADRRTPRPLGPTPSCSEGASKDTTTSMPASRHVWSSPGSYASRCSRTMTDVVPKPPNSMRYSSARNLCSCLTAT